jgi:hypothetical protein
MKVLVRLNEYAFETGEPKSKLREFIARIQSVLLFEGFADTRDFGGLNSTRAPVPDLIAARVRKARQTGTSLDYADHLFAPGAGLCEFLKLFSDVHFGPLTFVL